LIGGHVDKRFSKIQFRKLLKIIPQAQGNFFRNKFVTPRMLRDDRFHRKIIRVVHVLVK